MVHRIVMYMYIYLRLAGCEASGQAAEEEEEGPWGPVHFCHGILPAGSAIRNLSFGGEKGWFSFLLRGWMESG